MKYQEQFVNFPGKQGLAIIFIYSEFDFFFDDLQLQIIASISPKASVENSSAQWAIFLAFSATW